MNPEHPWAHLEPIHAVEEPAWVKQSCQWLADNPEAAKHFDWHKWMHDPDFRHEFVKTFFPDIDHQTRTE